MRIEFLRVGCAAALRLGMGVFAAGVLGLGTVVLGQGGAAATPAAGPAGATKRGINLDDLAKLARVGGPEVSPDGKWVAYTVSQVDVGEDKGVSALWMVSWDGREDVRLTWGTESAGSPKWSPDGRWLAFTSAREGEAKGSQVWLLDRRGGEARQLTNVKEDLQDFRWSPDSKQMLLTLEEKEEPEPEKGAKPKPPKPVVLDRYHFKQDMHGYLSDKRPHLFLFDVATKKVTKLTSGPLTGEKAYEENEAEWSPDGREIAFVSKQEAPDPDRGNNSDVFVVEAKAGAAPRKLTTFAGSDQGPLVWTPDSKRIVYRQGLTPHYAIYDMTQMAAVPAAGGAVEMLAPKLDQWVSAPVLSVDGKGVLAGVAEDRAEYVGEFGLDGKATTAKRMSTERGAAMGLSQAGGHVALAWTTDNAPAEVYALEPGGKLRKLTSHNDTLMAGLTMAEVKDVSAKAPDGNEVHSLLTMPVGYVAGTKAPMILFIHGGPTGQDAHGFSMERQLLAAHGYAVLNVNYRGSTGRGHAYSETINADWGNKEVVDLQAAVDAAIATGTIDPDKMGVGGWSYGGILTDYTIATTTRFKAASSGAGMGNLLGLYGVDEYILQYENEIGPPWKNPELYVKLSYPFFHADRIKTPTLFMGGDKDANVPVQGGEQMYEALKSVGTPAELIVYPGQFHGLTRPSFIRDRYQRWFDWYDKYVRGMDVKLPTPVPVPPAPSKAAGE